MMVLHSHLIIKNTLKKEIKMPTAATTGNNSETDRDTWSSSSKQFLGVVVLLVTVMITLIQVKYQSHDESSPFNDTISRKIMESFVVVIYVYAVTLAAQIIARGSCGKMFGEMSFFCGALASILLVLLLFPPFGLFLITLWGVSAFIWFLHIGIIPFVRRMYGELDYKTLWDKFWSIISCYGHNSADQHQQLPV